MSDDIPDESSVPCNLCGSLDIDVLFEPGRAQISRIVRCRGCSLMYASPRARGADVESIVTWETDGRMVERNQQRIAKERLQVRDYRKTRDLINELRPQRGALLEVGGGLGYLLAEFARDGWDVTLVEPWRQGCEYAAATHGITTIAKPLEEAVVADASVQVLLMLHVIEHLPDPAATLREIHRVLAPGGLLVLETPRYDTLAFKVLGRRERSISCDGHIYFFTRETLARMVSEAGFSVIESRPVGRHLTIDRLAWNLGTVTRNEGLGKALTRAARKMGLDQRAMHINLRDMQRLVLQKPQ